MSNLRNYITKFFLLLLGVIFTVGLGELFFRLSPEYSSKYDLKQYHASSTLQHSLNKEYQEYRASALLGYERIPNSEDANSYGMKGKEYPIEKEKDTFRILVLGDSITEDHWYIESLEQKLNNDATLKCNFQLWNAAVGGYNVNQYTNYLKYKGLKYNPDMVIIGFCLNDFNISNTVVIYKDRAGFFEYYYPGYRLTARFPILNRYLFRHSYLYRGLIIRLENLLATSEKQGDHTGNSRRVVGLYFLRIAKKICTDRKIPIVGIVFPYLKPLDEYMDYERDEYSQMLKVLEELEIDFIDLTNYFKDKDLYALRMQENDYIHPCQEGHEVAAEAIYKYLIEKYFPFHLKPYQDVSNDAIK